MVLNYQNINNNLNNQAHLTFNSNKKNNKGVLTRPIENVQTVIESGVDTIINNPNEDIRKKKRRRQAIAAGSTVLVVGALTMLLNPRNAGKLTNRINKIKESINLRIKENNSNSIKNSFLKLYKGSLDKLEKAGNFYYNLNSGKDWFVDSICTNSKKEYPDFLKKNKFIYKVVKKIDDVCVKIFSTPHQKITEFFDNISKKTVKGKYKKALKDMTKLEITLKSVKDSLPKEKQKILEQKLREIAKAKRVFSEEELLIRLQKQENLMAHLKEEFSDIIYTKEKGWFNRKCDFWVKEILEPQKGQVKKEGKAYVEKLFGTPQKQGLYDETVDFLKEFIDEKHLKIVERDLQRARNATKKANISECFEYFDKKRDLVIGGAPTDILTQIGGVALCGVAVANAEKENRWSKLFTTGVPIITGLLSSLIFSAKLLSGAKSVIAGAVVGGVTDVSCRVINKYVFNNDDEDNKAIEEKTMEAKNA